MHRLEDWNLIPSWDEYFSIHHYQFVQERQPIQQPSMQQALRAPSLEVTNRNVKISILTQGYTLPAGILPRRQATGA
jgi:hypothetical protein